MYKKILIIICAVMLIFFISFVFLFKTENKKIIYSTDTLFMTDTIFLKYEKVIPKRIYVYKTDTLRVIKEVIGKAEMKRDELTIIMQDKKDSTVKKYEFENIHRDFVLYSDSSGINLYRKNFGWDGIKINAGLSNVNFCDSIKSKLYIGIETGIYYRRLNFNIGINYLPFAGRFGVDAGISFFIR